jgi:hypothetical protein
MSKLTVKEASSRDQAGEPPSPLDGWLAPSRPLLEQGNLVCPLADDWHTVTTGPRMLEDFIRLADGGADVAEYARRWGALLVCEAHGMPVTHLPSVIPGGSDCCPPRRLEGAYWTRIDEWQRYARVARAVRRIAGALRLGETGRADDWDTLHRAHEFGLETLMLAEESAGLSVDRVAWHRREIAYLVGLWLHMGGVQPRLQWESSVPRIVLSSGQFGAAGFFGALAIQLMLAVSDARELVECSFCGRPYVPARKPNPNRDHYCPDCGRSAALSRASARHREKQRERSASKDAPASKG